MNFRPTLYYYTKNKIMKHQNHYILLSQEVYNFVFKVTFILQHNIYTWYSHVTKMHQTAYSIVNFDPYWFVVVLSAFHKYMFCVDGIKTLDGIQNIC